MFKSYTKVFSVVTVVAVGMSSLAMTAAPAKAGGEAVAAGILGFTAGAIVGSHARPRYYSHRYYGPRYYGHRTYYRPYRTRKVYRAPRRSAEERQYWRTVQDALNRSGFAAGPVDGSPGRLTRAAIRNYQLSLPAEPTGKLTPEQTQTLFAKAQEMDQARASYYQAPTPQAQPSAPIQTQVQPVAPQVQTQTAPELISVSTDAPVKTVETSSAPQTAKVEIDEEGKPFIMVGGQKLLLQTGDAAN